MLSFHFCDLQNIRHLLQETFTATSFAELGNPWTKFSFPRYTREKWPSNHKKATTRRHDCHQRLLLLLHYNYNAITIIANNLSWCSRTSEKRADIIESVWQKKERSEVANRQHALCSLQLQETLTLTKANLCFKAGSLAVEMKRRWNPIQFRTFRQCQHVVMLYCKQRVWGNTNRPKNGRTSLCEFKEQQPDNTLTVHQFFITNAD